VPKFISAVTLPLLFTCLACAQTSRPPAPSPELQKLDFFAGTWKTEGTLQVSPSVPPGSFTTIDHTAWLKGGVFIVTHSDVHTQFGEGEQMEIISSDSSRKLYTYNSFNGGGHAEIATGTLNGDTWIWLSDPTAAGPKSRFTQTILSPNSFSAKLDVSMDGTSWFTCMQGTVTRQ
jgi:hypothetical protein